MENVYIQLGEGSKTPRTIKRQFTRDVLERDFESIIRDMISHKGDELNQPYDSNEKQHLPYISETFDKGMEKGNLNVVYQSLDDQLKKTSLTNRPCDYDDFLKEDTDFLDVGTTEFGYGTILICKDGIGGYQ